VPPERERKMEGGVDIAFAVWIKIKDVIFPLTFKKLKLTCNIVSRHSDGVMWVAVLKLGCHEEDISESWGGGAADWWEPVFCALFFDLANSCGFHRIYNYGEFWW
jgi:hypothetical protein